MRRLLRYFDGLTADIVLGPLFKLAEAAIDLAVPIVILKMIEGGIELGDTAYTVRMMFVLILMGVSGLILAVTAQFFCARAACVFSGRVRKALLEQVTVMSAGDACKAGDATLVTRMTADIDQIQNGVNLTLRLFLRAPVIVVGATVLAFFVNARLAVIFCILIPCLAASIVVIMHISSVRYEKTRRDLDDIVVMARENISGVRTFRAYNADEKNIPLFNRRSDGLASLSVRAGNISSLLNPLTYVLVNIAVIAVLASGNMLFAAGFAAAGEIIALCNYMTQILTEIVKFANLVFSISKANVCAARVADVIFDTRIQKAEKVTGVSEHLIEFRDVDFSYGGEPVLKKISFTVDRSERVGIIGGTGSGKTTVASLICRIYEAESGNVFFDGADVLSYEPLDLRKKISAVPQKCCLFRGTVASNVAFGESEPDEDLILDSLRYAQAYDFVAGSEKGIYSEITDGGKNLSGGQRQRLTIARALYRRSDVLILDDFNSALDYSTDRALRNKLFSLPWDPAVIVISQRFSSVMPCDRIIVLDDGVIAGIGSHEELLSGCPVYREIYESQTEGSLNGY